VNRLHVAGAALLAVGLVLLGVVGWRELRPDEGSGAAGSLIAHLASATPADEPFAQLTQTEIRVGDQSLSVVIADDDDERGQGLRGRETIGAYDGMLFAFDQDSSTAFTMSTVPVPLDIGFYDAAGHVVDRLRMEPCADSDAACPIYQAKGAFRYALETLADDLPRGPLS